MMSVRVAASLGGALGRFRRDQSGLTLIYVTLALPVIIGFALLAIDVSRVWSLQSSLQHGADALALAGAGELDRRSDAQTRATRAIDNLVSNPALFADSVATITGANVTIRYYAAIPASDVQPIDPSTATADSTVTRFVQVTVTPAGITSLFPATFLGAATNTAQASAEAVAGFDAAVCDFTPMFICNPYESLTNTDPMEDTELRKHFDEVNYPDRIGRLINLKQTGGNSAQYFPGNFGFLQPQPPNNPGASDLRRLVAVDKPPACFVQNGVELRTGAIASIRFGFNTRFDMYDGPMNGMKNQFAYRPARNVRKGMATDKTTGNGKGTACNPDELSVPTNASKLLRDNCFSTNSCPNMGGRMGDGTWDKATYWARSHNGASLPPSISGSNVSRYDVYQFEIGNPILYLQDDSNGAPQGGEKGAPGCYNGPAIPDPDPIDRRIFHGAVLNCRALDNPANGGPIRGGSSGPLPAVAFVKFFLTEPVDAVNPANKASESEADGDVWAEMVGIDEPGSASSVNRDMVQLYR